MSRSFCYSRTILTIPLLILFGEADSVSTPNTELGSISLFPAISVAIVGISAANASNILIGSPSLSDDEI